LRRGSGAARIARTWLPKGKRAKNSQYASAR
jgi:hypothetical protein